MTEYTSKSYEVFGEDACGGVYSQASTHSIDVARKSFRHFRDDLQLSRIRVKETIYTLGSDERQYKWLCDWRRA